MQINWVKENETYYISRGVISERYYFDLLKLGNHNAYYDCGKNLFELYNYSFRI